MKAKRIFEIEAYINQQKAVTLEELCVHFDVSLNTIRRDINELTNLTALRKCMAVLKPSTLHCHLR